MRGRRCRHAVSGIQIRSRHLIAPGRRVRAYGRRAGGSEFWFSLRPGHRRRAGWEGIGDSGSAVGAGSCIFVVATNAPLAAIDLRRVAWRCFLGMARTGAISGHTSGDLAVAFSTHPRQEQQERAALNELFRATVEASEEAILNALFMAETTEGRDRHIMPALPIPEVVMILRRHGIALREVGQGN